MVPRPLVPARATRSPTCADVSQPCCSHSTLATVAVMSSQPRSQGPLSTSRKEGGRDGTLGTRLMSSVADISSDVIGYTEPIISWVLSNNTQHKTGN